MHLTTSLASRLAQEYPAFQFQSGNDFYWSPTLQTIFYEESDDTTSLLHELAHAQLNHRGYKKDIELIEMERDAWQRTRELGPVYSTEISEEDAEDALDTYRDWLHARSKCPNCSATGIQARKDTYRCFTCETSWRVNDARLCALRRHVIKQNTPR